MHSPKRRQSDVTKDAAVAQAIFVFSSKSAKQMQEYLITLKKL
jgi:hypothetical protein